MHVLVLRLAILVFAISFVAWCARAVAILVGRVRYETVTDGEALEAFHALAQLEGILPALESAHAIAWTMRGREDRSPDDVVLVNLSGRGDKDVAHVAAVTKAEW